MAVPKFITNDMKGGYVGGPTTPARRCYVGGTLVYQGFSPASEQEFIQQEATGGPAQLLKVYGKSIAWAQLVKNGDFSDGTTNWQGNNGSTISAAGGILTWTATNTLIYASLRQASTGFLNGHKYFVSFITKGAQANKLNFALGNAAGGGVSGSFDYGTDWTTIQAIISPLTATDFSLYIRPNAMAVSGAVAYFKGPIVIIDLTLLYDGAGHEPASVAAFLADYPEYNPTYDPGSLQSNKTAELRAERIPVINVWDEEWEVGAINTSTGQDYSSSTVVRCQGYIPVTGGATYYFKIGSKTIQMMQFDANHTFLTGWNGPYSHKGFTTSGEWTLLANCAYIRIQLLSTTTYDGDICINLSDPAINGQYFPHWRGSLQLNLSTLTGKLNGEGASVVVFPDGMRGVGDIRDEAEGSTGVVRRQKITGASFTLHNTSSAGYKTYKAILNGPTESAFRASQVNTFGIAKYGYFDSSSVTEEIIQYSSIAGRESYIAIAPNRSIDDFEMEYPLADPLTYTLDTPLPTDLPCEQGDILQRVSDNNCPFVGEMKFGL